jgi:hypothetical protein
MATLALLPLGCPEGDPPPEEPLPVRLARVDQWVRVTDADTDLFAAGRPEGLTCDEVMGYGLEDFGPDVVFEVMTDLCDWFTGEQPTLEPISPGDTVTVKVWHYDLVAEMDTEAYVAIAIGGQIEWEATIPIPSTGNLLEADIVMDRELPAGTPIQFHVHNHGPNSWELFDVMVTPEADAG